MGAVTVDDGFVRFGNKSYAINKINSVEVRERQPHGRGGAIVCACLAVLLLVSGLGQLTAGREAGVMFFVISAFLGFLAYRGFEKAKIREYQLFLMTSSSEAQAFMTRDEGEIYDLRQQIETAMVRQSRSGSER